MTEVRHAALRVGFENLAREKIGGITVLERQLHSLCRAGVERIDVEGIEAEAAKGLRLPQGVAVSWLGKSGQSSAAVAVSGQHFFVPEALAQALRALPDEPCVIMDAQGHLAAQKASRSGLSLVASLKRALPAGAAVCFEPPMPRRGVLAWIGLSGVKRSDGFMARHVDRRISWFVSKRLLDTAVTPNMMTTMSSIIGLLGAAAFLYPGHDRRVWGALLVLLHSILDGCDGEIARARFEESRLGGELDFWGDNLVHVALFSCLAVGFFRQTGDRWALILGLSAGLGTLGSAAVFFRQRILRRLEPANPDNGDAAGESRSLWKMEDVLAGRDFIYLLVILSLVHLDYRFLQAAALGAPAFFFLAIYLWRMDHERKADRYQAC
ncbi:MAG: CDP-alcohol phosphatidyltransferase family protein [Elusimicrobiota bacterium]